MMILSIGEFNVLYWEEELSYRSIAEKLGVSPNAVRAWIKHYKDKGLITTRTRSQAIKAAAKNGRYDHKGANNPNYVDGRCTEEGKHRCYTYGITIAEYESLLETQSSKCAICKELFTGTPHIDHCHTTGDVRGLLCRCCNHGIGLLKDSAELLEAAVTYVSKTHPYVGTVTYPSLLNRQESIQ
ncbi:MAG: endonuclease domain-containing protein [Thiomicrorhabdus sp.]|jgi:DNA-binding CsgD family transcriptional regulator|nr:endonuclease domain-containing protein [Thiomicrorhabdus sp.]